MNEKEIKQNGPGEWLAKANRLRCIADRKTGRYRLRIEDVNGEPLTDFKEYSTTEASLASRNSVLPHTKEYLAISESHVEDYRVVIVNEEILKARLYPDS